MLVEWDSPAAFCSADGQMLASVGADQSVCLWNLQTAELFHRFEDHAVPVFDVAISTDQSWIATCGVNDRRRGEVITWHTRQPGKRSHTT